MSVPKEFERQKLREAPVWTHTTNKHDAASG
jgi:hypothetical protein